MAIVAVWALLFGAPQVVADDPRPTANAPAEIARVDDSAAHETTEAADSAWSHQTIKRPAEPLRALRHGGRDESGEPHRASSGVKQSGLGSLDLLWPLGVVLLVIAGVTVVLRKVMPRTNRAGAGGVINILANHYLSNKQSLCLVRLGRRAVLLGITPERIAAVAEITDRDELADIVSTIERKRPGSFTSTFSRLYGRDLAAKPAEDGDERQDLVKGAALASAGSSLRELVERVRLLSGKTPSAEST